MTTIAVVNNKGGSGKTTTTHHLTIALRNLGLSVLAIDNDGQANLTRAFAQDAIAAGGSGCPTLVDFLRGDKTLPAVIIPGMDLIPATGELDDVSHEMSTPGKSGRLFRLQNALRQHPAYDIVLIDCPPNVGALTYSALLAADYVIIPSQAEQWSYEGVERIINLLREMNSDMGNAPRILGTIATQVENNLTHNRFLSRLRCWPGVPYIGSVPKRKGQNATGELQFYYRGIAEDIAIKLEAGK